MTHKLPQDLQHHLSEQLQLLEISANHYDQGCEIEAKNMTVRLRVLLHDSGKSQSLLAQLGLKNTKFVDTAIDDTSNVKTAYYALVDVLLAGGKTKYVALLDNRLSKMTNFDCWWNRVIFMDDEENEISRKKLILTMADQAGGAHVDPCIERDYSRLSEGQSLGDAYSNGSGWFHMQGAELASVRQIAHEVLKSLKPDYVKKPNLPNGIIKFGSSIRIELKKE